MAAARRIGGGARLSGAALRPAEARALRAAGPDGLRPATGIGRKAPARAAVGWTAAGTATVAALASTIGARCGRSTGAASDASSSDPAGL
ncbi:hypothetical protein HPGCJGGD_3997 [Methylobacterium haplocladii]|nr:hypothetical protein HPGCJGGD_3997 [Methylobacterium haplocladii]